MRFSTVSTTLIAAAMALTPAAAANNPAAPLSLDSAVQTADAGGGGGGGVSTSVVVGLVFLVAILAVGLVEDGSSDSP